jgi:ABC-type glycerol-3-phosphate transport system substrate-binding protein
MHLNRIHAAVAALVLAMLIAACGGSASSATASPTASPEPTTTATNVAPSAGAVADLEALIPAEIGGITLQKSSMSGDQFVNSGSTSQELQDFLGGLGVAVEDVAIAIGVGLSTESGEAAAMFAFRADGADTDRLVNGFKEAYDADNDRGLVWEPVSIGGKSAERTTNPEQPNQVIYLYAKDDILFFLTTATEEQAAEALAALP